MIINLGYCINGDKIQSNSSQGFTFWIEKSDNPNFQGHHPIWQVEHEINPQTTLLPSTPGFYRIQYYVIGVQFHLLRNLPNRKTFFS